MDYNSIYTQILDIPQEIKIMPAGKNLNGSKKYVSKPLRRNECLKRIFGIDANDALFDHAFQQVTSGKGQELKRITTLQSSSLLGLLVFYRVTKYPVIINNIKYTQAFFEVESNVGSNSSIDVMLVSEDSRILLFLELKFTEFLSLGDYYWIDNKYLDIYTSITDVLFEAGIKVGEIERRDHKNKESTFEFKISGYDKQKQYFAGIKQMISHLIGLMRRPLSGSNELFDTFIKNKNPKIILGTMLYDMSSTGNPRFTAQYNSYLSIYARTMNQYEKLKECIKNDLRITIDYNIEVLKEPLSYQKDIKGIDGNSPSMPKVKDIYRL